MPTFVMVGKYSADAIKKISAKRTDDCAKLIKGLKGEVKGMYALLGAHDLLLIVTFPGVEEALKASVALSKATGIGFTTSPAISVAEFDKLMA